ncbi:MAG: hypothetical protein ACOY4I_05925 [Bacillota bacterium]
MKRPLIIATIIVFFIFCTPAFAEVVLDDAFNDTECVDLTRTTARVDTVNHYVLLPWQSLAGAVDVLENGFGYATASGEGIRLYELNDATGKVEINPVYSCPWAAEATGVSIRQDNLNVWAITGDSIAYYRFNGSGMADDPALKVSGLTGVLSVAAFKNSDSALLLQREGNRARVTRYEAGSGLNPALIFQPDIADPVRVSMVNYSPDFVLFSKTAAYYFSYDEAGGTYVEDPARRITGLADVISASSDDVGSSVLTGTDLGYYMNDDSGGAARVEVFSPGPVTGPVAVSLKTGTCEQVLLDENGNVQWWTYDDAAGRMVIDPGLGVSGLNINRGYAHPGNYFSRVITTAVTYDAVRLTVTDDRPAGTSISYSVSTDGGSAFTEISPGTWTAVPRGSRFVLRAVLDTTDPRLTPEIHRVILEADEDLVLEGQVIPYPAERGRNVTISARAVSLSAGARVTLDSCLVTYPLETRADGGPALPGGQLPTEAYMVYNPGSGNWEYTFTVPEKNLDGRWPDNGVYRIRITGIKGTSQKELILNLEINGHILRRLIIRTLSW